MLDREGPEYFPLPLQGDPNILEGVEAGAGGTVPALAAAQAARARASTHKLTARRSVGPLEARGTLHISVQFDSVEIGKRVDRAMADTVQRLIERLVRRMHRDLGPIVDATAHYKVAPRDFATEDTREETVAVAAAALLDYLYAALGALNAQLYESLFAQVHIHLWRAVVAELHNALLPSIEHELATTVHPGHKRDKFVRPSRGGRLSRLFKGSKGRTWLSPEQVTLVSELYDVRLRPVERLPGLCGLVAYTVPVCIAAAAAAVLCYPPCST